MQVGMPSRDLWNGAVWSTRVIMMASPPVLSRHVFPFLSLGRFAGACRPPAPRTTDGARPHMAGRPLACPLRPFAFFFYSV